MLMQNPIPFHTLDRDDASTDATLIVLQNFEERLPTVIQVDYETVDQFRETAAYDSLMGQARRRHVSSFEVTTAGRILRNFESRSRSSSQIWTR